MELCVVTHIINFAITVDMNLTAYDTYKTVSNMSGKLVCPTPVCSTTNQENKNIILQVEIGAT